MATATSPVATGFKRIWLVYKKYVRPNLLEDYGLKKFCNTAPIPVYPLYGWKPEHGITCYGYLLENLQLEDVEALKEVVLHHGKGSLLVIETIRDAETGKNREETVEEALKRVSNQINKSFNIGAKSSIKIPDKQA